MTTRDSAGVTPEAAVIREPELINTDIHSIPTTGHLLSLVSSLTAVNNSETEPSSSPTSFTAITIVIIRLVFVVFVEAHRQKKEAKGAKARVLV